jgi:hypothetical protein
MDKKKREGELKTMHEMSLGFKMLSSLWNQTTTQEEKRTDSDD